MPSSSKGTARAGTLFLVATPIGNLEDITLRALRTLKEASCIACEDTRHTQKLLNHYGISKRLVSYHEHNELTRAAELVVELEQGASVALVSDAGMPAISDPGHHLVSLCRRHHIPVVPIPGASALVAALAASGISTESFLFLGFPPSRAGQRRRALGELKSSPHTLVFYEAPHRLVETLRDAQEVFGEREAVAAREVTKVHEEFLSGTLGQLCAAFEKKPPRGEITLLISGAAGSASHGAAHPDGDGRKVSLAARVEAIARESGVDRKTALKFAARELGLTRREAYKQMLLGRSPGPS